MKDWAIGSLLVRLAGPTIGRRERAIVASTLSIVLDAIALAIGRPTWATPLDNSHYQGWGRLSNGTNLIVFKIVSVAAGGAVADRSSVTSRWRVTYTESARGSSCGK